MRSMRSLPPALRRIAATGIASSPSPPARILRYCAKRAPCAMFSAVSPIVERSISRVFFFVEIASMRLREPARKGNGKPNQESPWARSFTRSPYPCSAMARRIRPFEFPDTITRRVMASRRGDRPAGVVFPHHERGHRDRGAPQPLEDPRGDDLARGIVEAWNLVQELVVELREERRHRGVDVREIAHPAEPRVER